ncbi:MAG: helix-turn-helix domain-containing protein [Actinomyces sp.]|nr:helix-turn-helix domain-containing protein [Actinomyces sp.]
MATQKRREGFHMMPRSIDSDDRLTVYARSVLMALSSRANEAGECWPSLDTIAQDAKVSKSTVQRAIKQLIECGYISKEKRTKRGRTIAPKYRMLFDKAGAASEKPSDVEGSQSDHPGYSHRPPRVVSQTMRGSQSDHRSIEREVDKGSKDKEVEPPISPKGGEDAKPKRKRHEYTSEFETFWSIYPRKDDKRRALTAFNNALERATLEQLCAGAERYANDPNREPQYTKHAATWLNGDCWLNPPLPARRVSDPWGDRVRSVLAAGQTQPPPPNVGYGYPPRLISGGDYDDL